MGDFTTSVKYVSLLVCVGVARSLLVLSNPMVNPSVNKTDVNNGGNLGFTKAQVEAIRLYLGIVVITGVVIFFLVYCNRCRREAKLHDTSSFPERDVESDSA